MFTRLFRTLVLFCPFLLRALQATPTGPQSRRVVSFALLTASALFAVGCATPFGSGVRAYEHGRYPEALEALASSDAFRDGGVEGVRYALYRGLTHLALGDLPLATGWLRRVKRALEANPSLLSANETGRFASAWAHLPLELAEARPLADTFRHLADQRNASFSHCAE